MYTEKKIIRRPRKSAGLRETDTKTEWKREGESERERESKNKTERRCRVKREIHGRINC